MNDQDRKNQFLEKAQSLEGLSEKQYVRLIVELKNATHPESTDAQGRLRIALFDAKAYDREFFATRNQDRFALEPIEVPLNTETAQLAEGFKVVCLFVNDVCDADVVKKLARAGVELIALRCAGYNNVDLAACQQYGLSVVRVPAYSPHAIAEHTIALIMMLNRHLHQAYMRNRMGYFVLEGLTGFDMYGKHVGVVGTGNIGRCVIDILLGFGCHILAFDKFPNDALAKHPKVNYVSLDELWQQSEIITLHAPLLPDTYHLVNAEAIAKMRPGVMLINTSRGGLVDTRALIAGLKSEKIRAAGLDVYEEEAGVFFHDVSGKVLTDDVLARLMTFNNVVITSHQAFLTEEALSNIADTTLQNIAEYQSGKRGNELTNAVSAI